MLDLSFPEIALVGLVALLVLGPKRLPVAARTVGAYIRKARQSLSSLRSEIERELSAEDIRSSLREAEQALKQNPLAESPKPAVRPETPQSPANTGNESGPA